MMKELPIIKINKEIQISLAAPIPVLAIVVRLLAAHPEERPKVFRQLVPAIHVGEEVTDPRARDVVVRK